MKWRGALIVESLEHFLVERDRVIKMAYPGTVMEIRENAPARPQ